MSNVNNGGPAFPIQGQRFELGDSLMTPAEPGMSLRDYFAAQAMLGCMSGHWPDRDERVVIADRAYLMADAMLKARQS